MFLILYGLDFFNNNFLIRFKNLEKMGKLNQWTQQEDQIIKLQIPKFRSRKWKNISKILSEKGFMRGEAQCRERYVNHLDPVLDKNNDITQEQLKILYGKYEQYGPKWCLIQTFVPNRTQIKIKNVFYGNIRLFLKKLYKHFTRRTAVFINDLKTDDLQTIYDGTQQFIGFNLMKKAFRKFHYQISQQNCTQIIQTNQTQYFQLLNKILEYKTKIRPLSRKFNSSDQDDSFIQNGNNSKLIIQNKILIKETINSTGIENNKKLSQDLNKKSLERENKDFQYNQGQKITRNFHQIPLALNFPISSGYYISSNYSSSCISNVHLIPQFYQYQQNWQPYPMQVWPIYQQNKSMDGNQFMDFQNFGVKNIISEIKNQGQQLY